MNPNVETDGRLMVGDVPVSIFCIELDSTLVTPELSGYSYTYPLGIGGELEEHGLEEITAEIIAAGVDYPIRDDDADSRDELLHRALEWRVSETNADNPFVKIGWAAGDLSQLPVSISDVDDESGVVLFRDPFAQIVRVFKGGDESNVIRAGKKVFAPSVNVVVQSEDSYWRIQYETFREPSVSVQRLVSVDMSASTESDISECVEWRDVEDSVQGEVLSVIQELTEENSAMPGGFSEQYVRTWIEMGESPVN